MHKMRLRRGGPDPIPGSIRMAEAGPVDGDDPVAFRKLIDEAADHEVLGHGPVAMDQNHGTALAPGDVVDPHAIHHDKAARGAAGLFSLQGLHGPGSPPDSFVGLLNSFVPLPDSGSGDLDRGLQGLGGLLGYEAGSAPGGSLDDARKQGGSLGL